jgi:hypothetical protein
MATDPNVDELPEKDHTSPQKRAYLVSEMVKLVSKEHVARVPPDWGAHELFKSSSELNPHTGTMGISMLPRTR